MVGPWRLVYNSKSILFFYVLLHLISFHIYECICSTSGFLDIFTLYDFILYIISKYTPLCLQIISSAFTWSMDLYFNSNFTFTFIAGINCFVSTSQIISRAGIGRWRFPKHNPSEETLLSITLHRCLWNPSVSPALYSWVFCFCVLACTFLVLCPKSPLA